VNWNLEYFGDKASELPNEMIYTKTIMDSLNADIYALVEVVNKDSLASLVNSLNGDYDYMIAPFGTLAPTITATDWAKDQKQAIVWKKSTVRNVTGRALMMSSTSAYDNWGSGRFPFLVNAEVVGKDSNWLPMQFVIIHAKAYSDNSSCNRRKNGAIELKDTLDQYFSNNHYILLGDFNDDLDSTICSNYMQSAYENFVLDSTHYAALTLPLSRQGVSSIIGYTSFIDHVIVNDKTLPYYLPGSAAMLKNKVNSWVTNYNTYLSDHFPVETKYIITNPNGINDVASSSFKVYPNPTNDKVFIEQPNEQGLSVEIYSMMGQRVFATILQEKKNTVSLAHLPTGNYLLRIANEGKTNSLSTMVFKK
jgi:hypothetical protein